MDLTLHTGIKDMPEDHYTFKAIYDQYERNMVLGM